MNGVAKITRTEDIMLVSFSDSPPAYLCETLQKLAKAGVVVDMISQTAPIGTNIRFSFTASVKYLDTVVKAIGAKQPTLPSPMISGGYSKLNLFGQDMVDSVGVGARALDALANNSIEIALITTSDLDISLLVRQEDEDMAYASLCKAFEL